MDFKEGIIPSFPGRYYPFLYARPPKIGKHGGFPIFSLIPSFAHPKASISPYLKKHAPHSFPQSFFI